MLKIKKQIQKLKIYKNKKNKIKIHMGQNLTLSDLKTNKIKSKNIHI